MIENETKKFENIENPGIRTFLAAGDAFYPADAVDFTIAEQRAFYDRYCAHFRRARPAGVTTADFAVNHVPCRHYRKMGNSRAPMMLCLHGGRC